MLLCPALSRDALNAYRGFRLLADQFASAGYPAVRFHYLGTGDSRDIMPGSDGRIEHWEAWQNNAHLMADWLLAATGAKRLILVGLRFGALVATHVAQQRDDVEALLLIAPVLRGKSYMRQLHMEAWLESGVTAHPSGSLEFHELRLSAATIQRISGADLRQAKLRAGMKVAVFAQAPSPLLDDCIRAWTAAGLTLQSHNFVGLESMLQETVNSDPPPPEFSVLLDWAKLNCPGHSHGVAYFDKSLFDSSKSSLELRDCSETPVRFGRDSQLFGILCKPKAVDSRRVVIIGNTGREPHIGIARFGVELARRLAVEGVASFRIDFAGLGDSRLPTELPDTLSSMFNIEHSGDIGAAIDALKLLGYHDFAVQGICSGAYHAFHAAEADSRVNSLLLINLPTFQWEASDTVREAIWKSAPPSRLLLKLSERATWARALQGKADYRATAGAIGRRLLASLRTKLSALFYSTNAVVRQKDARDVVALLSSRRVTTLFLYSAGDPGLDSLVAAFGKDGNGLRTFEGVDLRIIEGIDHILSCRSMREKAAGEMISFLSARSETGCRSTT